MRVIGVGQGNFFPQIKSGFDDTIFMGHFFMAH